MMYHAKLSLSLALLFWLVVLAKSTTSVEHILVLGGDGMLGSATVNQFLSANKQNLRYNLTLLNRGNWYWDTEETIKPFVRFIRCTRGNGFRSSCQQLNDGIVYDVVIDFSCYHPLDMEDILIILRGRIRKYIYISTDSVYEVSREKQSEDLYSTEEDAVRPDDKDLQSELNKKDNYGHLKLQGEETLQKYHKLLKFEYIALRLPDIIGPRDNTNRFWKCVMWAKLNHIIGPITIPDELVEKPISLVYSLDVGKLVFQLVENPTPGVYNSVYNLGFEETITLPLLFKSIAKYLQNGSLEFGSGAWKIGIPSVTRGPINISRAVQQLDWKPTDIQVAIKDTFTFYNDVQFNPEYKYILERILVYFEIQGDKYRDFVASHHAEVVERNKDEL